MSPRFGNYTLLLILKIRELALPENTNGIENEGVRRNFAVHYERCFRLTGSCMLGLAVRGRRAVRLRGNRATSMIRFVS